MMTLIELATIARSNVVVRSRPSDPVWYAKIEGAEVMACGMLVGSYGDGNTPLGAIEDYVPKIRGRRLALNAGSSSRREIDVPETLVAG